MSLAWVLAAVPVLACLSLAHGLEDQALCAGVSPASGTSGTIDKVAGLRNTIGYAGLDAVIERQAEEEEGASCRIKMARMVNKFGAIVSPSTDTAQAAVRANTNTLRASSDCAGFGLCAEIMDAGDSDVWPITTLTYFVVGLNNTDAEHGCDKMKSVYDYTKWILTSQGAADIASSLQFAAMPHSVSSAALEVLDEMNCTMGDGTVKRVKDMTTSATSIQGAGSSLQAALQTKLTNQYNLDTSIQVTYESTGSGTGKSRMTDNVVDFAGSDSLIATTNPKVIARQQRMIPVFAAAVCIMYNNKDVEDLVLSRKAVDDIFTGRITSWSNPEIMASNPGKEWPNDAMVRVVRSDKSGTTETITRTLYNFAGLPHPPVYSDHVLEGSSDPAWPSASVPFQDGAQCTYKNCTKAVCSPGYYLDPTEDTCAECRVGKFSPVRGQLTSCTNCPPGTHTNTLGNSQCAKCDDSRYQDESGQSSCKDCPEHTRRFFFERRINTPSGIAIVLEATPGVAAGECFCEAGFWLPQSVNNSGKGGLACKTCPNGATCEGFANNEQQRPITVRNFWGMPDFPSTFLECKPGACLADYQCMKGHKGRMCTQPSSGFFTVAGRFFLTCPGGDEAGGSNAAMSLFAVFCLVCFWIVLQNLTTASYDSMTAILMFVQMISFVTMFNLRWHPYLDNLGAALGIFSFGVDFFGPQCFIKNWNGGVVFFLQLSLPLILAALYLIFFIIRINLPGGNGGQLMEKTVRSKAVLRHFFYLPDEASTYVTVKAMSFTALMLHTLTLRCFSVFVCDYAPDGKTSFISFAPDVECGSNMHSAMVIVSVIYIPIFFILLPIYTTQKMLHGHKTKLLNSYTFMEAHGWMYLKYKQEFAWWEVTLMARRIFTALILVFLRVPMLQAALGVGLNMFFLVINLLFRPYVKAKVNALDSVCIFATMVYCMSGMIFYPAIDSSVQCVGSDDLVGRIGEECRLNQDTKEGTAVVVVLMIASVLAYGAWAVTDTILERVWAARAAAKLSAYRKEWGLWASRKTSKRGSCTGNIDELSDQGSGPRKSKTSRWLSGAMNTSFDRNSKMTEGLPDQEDLQQEFFNDPFEVKLEDMINGFRLIKWQERLAANRIANCDSGLPDLEEVAAQIPRSSQRMHNDQTILALTLGKDGVNELVRQELSFCDLGNVVPRFVTIYDHVHGFYSLDAFSKMMLPLVESMPGLIEWLADAEEDLVAAFAEFADKFTIFRGSYAGQATNDIVMKEHRGSVIHWLMECSEPDRAQFSLLMTAIAEAAGLPNFKNEKQGISHRAARNKKDPQPGKDSSPAPTATILANAVGWRKPPQNGHMEPRGTTAEGCSGLALSKAPSVASSHDDIVPWWEKEEAETTGQNAGGAEEAKTPTWDKSRVSTQLSAQDVEDWPDQRGM